MWGAVRISSSEANHDHSSLSYALAFIGFRFAIIDSAACCAFTRKHFEKRASAGLAALLCTAHAAAQLPDSRGRAIAVAGAVCYGAEFYWRAGLVCGCGVCLV